MNILATIPQRSNSQISKALKLYRFPYCLKLGVQVINQSKRIWYMRQLKPRLSVKGFGNIFQHGRVSCFQQNFHQYFHTTSRRPVNPLLLVLVKFKGLKVLKAASILFGRTGRKLHARLPSTIQHQFSKHKIIFSSCLIMLFTIAYYSYAHYDVCPLTGRKRWISFTRDQILVLAKMDHEHLLKMYSKKFINADEQVHRICSALVKGLVSSNQDIDIVKDINWNLNIVHDDDLQNAFVLPNGEIYLFTGMIHMMNNWEELAIVLGHEMAHAVLGHVQEQQSFAVFGELLLIPLLTFIWFWFDDFVAFITYSMQQYIFPLVFEVGFNLPYSRQLESEADIVGLNLAAKACFDPRWGVLLWDKLALKEAVDKITNEEDFNIEFLSSHPSHDKRAANMEARLSEIIAIRDKCNCPKLSTSVNPVLDAHRLRKFVVNIRERTELANQIKEIESKMKLNENTDPNAVATCQKLEQRFSVLTLEYESLLKEEGVTEATHLKSSVEAARHSEEGGQSSRSQKNSYLWSNIVGSFINYKSIAPVVTKQETLITQDLGSNTFGRRHVKRDYYNSFEKDGVNKSLLGLFLLGPVVLCSTAAMDLLGSILGSMEKPPTVSANERKKAKCEEEKIAKLKMQERIQKEKFRKTVEAILSKFVKDGSKMRERLKAMTKLERSLVHEMADEAGITTQAFGQEEHDRYVMLFKKDHPASEDELAAYRRGETWNEEKAEECKKRKEEEMQSRLLEKSDDPPCNTTPSSNYKDKYNHIIGTSAAKDAARKTEANQSFGMVPSLNKRDQRSIEETMNEIRAKKRQKTENDSAS